MPSSMKSGMKEYAEDEDEELASSMNFLKSKGRCRSASERRSRTGPITGDSTTGECSHGTAMGDHKKWIEHVLTIAKLALHGLECRQTITSRRRRL